MNKDTYYDFLLSNESSWENLTPCFIINKEQLYSTIKTVKELLPGEVVYSHKTNSNQYITKAVCESGCGFLLSSVEESEKIVKEPGVSMEKIIFQSPSLTREQYERLKSLGISRYIVDSDEQLEVVLSSFEGMARKPEILVRVNTGVTVTNPELCYSTDSYLGFPITDAARVFKKLNALREKGLITLGLHNHLLSQNTFLELWEKNLSVMGDYVAKLKAEGVILDRVDFGGGYPIYYSNEVPTIEEISSLMKTATEKMRRSFPDLNFVFEPGRKIVGESITLVTKVVHTKEFRGSHAAILNCSVYNAAMDTLIVALYLPLSVIGKTTDKSKEYVVRGSTPDSLDVFAKKALLPELVAGDHIAFFHAGAYSFWSDFISLKRPEYILV